MTAAFGLGDGINTVNLVSAIRMIETRLRKWVRIKTGLLCLRKETITIPGTYKPAAYSINGGGKWTDIKDELSEKTFPKLLKKGLLLQLSNLPVDKATKRPSGSALIVSFARINKSPASPKLVANYAAGSDSSGLLPGDWLLTYKKSLKEVKYGIQVGTALEKTVNKKGFGQFYYGETNGIAVEPYNGTKVTKSVYFIRTAPKYNEAKNEYTAAGKPKKITVTSVRKPPNYKVKSAAEKKNKDGSVKSPLKSIIKAKPNTYISINGEEPVFYINKTDIDVLNIKGTVELCMAETDKKPVSARQGINR